MLPFYSNTNNSNIDKHGLIGNRVHLQGFCKPFDQNKTIKSYILPYIIKSSKLSRVMNENVHPPVVQQFVREVTFHLTTQTSTYKFSSICV